MRPRRITVVANELRGFEPAGGLGTATTFLALALARRCHDVEVLLFGHSTSQPVDTAWTPIYADAGVRIRSVCKSSEQDVEPRYFESLAEIEQALRAETPDVVIAQDGSAPAYSALRLRQLAIAHSETPFVIFCHGTRGWIKDMARNIRVFPYLLGLMTLERASMELADIVVSPSSYLLEWMREQGWRLPDRSLVIPYLTESIAMGKPPPTRSAEETGPVERLTFFGRLDVRKGIRPFVAALNTLPTDLLEQIELEFLGPEIPMRRDRVEELLSPTTKRAVRRISFVTDLDRDRALSRLSRRGTLAVMPSLEDNSPNTVYECLEHGIPFLASHRGGTAELIAPEDRDRVLFEPTADGVELVLRAALQDANALRPARAAFDPGDSLRAWEEVIETAAAPRRKTPRAHPLVAVVIVHRGSGTSPSRCLSALQRQTYPRVNVITVGYGDAHSLNAAFRTEVLAGSPAFVIFLDEQDEPNEEFVASLVRAQAASGADVVTCGFKLHDSDQHHLFLGDPGALGLPDNTYGTPALIRREVLESLEQWWPVDVDAEWPFLARLFLGAACIVSIPLPLLSRAVRPSSLEEDPLRALSVVDEHEAALPAPLRGLARLAAGLAAPSRRAVTGSHDGMLRRAWNLTRSEGLGEVTRRLISERR